MAFLGLVWRGLKAHLALSLAIGIGYWILILRLDIGGELPAALTQVLLSTSIIVFSAPFFAFIIGMYQGKSTKRVSDAGLAGALSGFIGFMALLCIPLLLALAAFTITADPPQEGAEADGEQTQSGVANGTEDISGEITSMIGEMSWLGLPAGLAGWFASSVAARERRSEELEQRSPENDQSRAARAHDTAALEAASAPAQPMQVSATPWVYAVGLIDADGYEWVEHLGQTWYRVANSGTEWELYAEQV